MPGIDPDLFRLADATGKAIQQFSTPKEQTAALKDIIDAADVFIGLVPDDHDGHTFLIKGEKLLKEIAAGEDEMPLVMGAIVNVSDEEAAAMWKVFGDGSIPMPTLH